MKTPERSVEEIVRDFTKEFEVERDFTSDPQFTVQIRDINDYTEWLTQTLQTERQRCEEMVEAEQKRLYNIALTKGWVALEKHLQALTQPNNLK